MTQPLKISYPAASTTAICAAQTTAGAGALIINGSLLDQAMTINGVRRVRLPRIARVVSLTSTGNLSAANITITGLDINLQPLTETRAGPNNNTVVTTALFYDIESVTSDAALATAMSVGTGAAGVTKWKVFDTWVPSGQTAINVNVVSGTVQYTVETTFDDVMTDATEANVQKIQDPLAINQTVDGVFAYESPYRAARVSFNSSTTGVADVYFMQVGGRT